MNRVLVVAYYTPPLGLSGVMRVTKLCKYLPDFSWEPIVLTVKPVVYYAYDPGLLADLARSKTIRTESLDLNRLLMHLGYKGVSRLAGAGRVSFLNHILLPDAKIGWYPFGASVGKRLLRDYQPQVVFATAPPWTALLIGKAVARAGGVPLVCDFRDPYPAGFQKPPFCQWWFLRRMLNRIVKSSALVLAVNRGTASTLKPEVSALDQQVEVLENGFDPEDMAVASEQLTGFSIVYVGNLYQNQEGLNEFLNAISQLPFVRFYLVGGVEKEGYQLLKSHPQVVILGRVEHRRAIAIMKGADALLYLGKPAQPVGLKLYEYLGTNRPIIVWGEGEREAGELVNEFDAGRVCTTVEQLMEFIAEIRESPHRFSQKERNRLSRRYQAEWLAQQLNRIVKN